jgi:mRNA-degrading endonuclease RelE of RelBE toxin-antitoxin system
VKPLRLDWSPAARRELKRLPAPDRERVLRTVNRFEQSGQGDVVKLTGVDPPEYRLRVGPWRVRFEWDQAAGIVIVLHVYPRGKAYR